MYHYLTNDIFYTNKKCYIISLSLHLVNFVVNYSILNDIDFVRFQYTVCSENNIQLDEDGILELCYQDHWRKVTVKSRDLWGINESRVVCRQLGYNGMYGNVH